MTSRIDIIKGEKDKITLEKKNEIVAAYEAQIAAIKQNNSDATELETLLAEIKEHLF
jgi:hypothetical protein